MAILDLVRGFIAPQVPTDQAKEALLDVSAMLTMMIRVTTARA